MQLYCYCGSTDQEKDYNMTGLSYSFDTHIQHLFSYKLPVLKNTEEVTRLGKLK